MSNATSLLLLEEESMLDEGVPWYRQVELIVTLVLAVVLVAGVIWHLMNLSEWAEESLQYVEMAAMETAQYAQQDRGPKSRSPRRGSPRGISSPELMSSTNSRVAVGAKAVAGAGKDTVLFAPRALVSAGISIKYRLHNVIDDVVQTAESLSPRWRAIWAFGNIIILGLALTVLMFIPGSFLLLFLAWTAFCSARGGDTDASAIDLITDMVSSTDMAAVSHLDGVERTKKSFVNPLLSSRDLEDGELQSASKSDGGNLLGPAAADGDVLFVGQKSGKVTRDEARALHTMLRMQQEQYAKQREAQERAERKREALKLFDEIDVDGNGTLDVEELTELAKSMGVELTPKQAELAFADLDTDASGEIDFDEFFTFYEANVGGHGGLRGGFNSFFGGFKLRLQTVGLNASKHQISHDPNANANSRGPNMKLASLKPGGGGGAGGGGSSSADARARTRAIDNAAYFEALVKGINKMAYARTLGMVDTNGDGIADALGYDTKGDGVADAFDTTGDGKIDAWDLNGNGKIDGYDTTGDGNVDAWDTTGDGKIDAADTTGDGKIDAADTTGDGQIDSKIDRSSSSGGGSSAGGSGRPDAAGATAKEALD